MEISADTAQPTVRGARVVLRPWTAADADEVFAICQDAEIQRWTRVPSPYARSDAIEYVTKVAAQAWDSGGAVFAVVDAETDRIVGTIGAHGMRDGIAHVGYWTRPEARGRGLTTDALRTLSRWLLGERGAVRVELVVEPDNAASVRVARSAGFTEEGLLRQRMNLRGRHADVLMFSMLITDAAAAGT